MATDPNADLIGRVVIVEGVRCTVTGSAPWSSQYVLLVCGEKKFKSTLQAAFLRR